MKNILDYLEITEHYYPNRPAVDDGSVRLTWRELKELAERFGTAFAKRTETGKPIAILADKSAAVLAAMLGTVYAGCFYVMIDPGHPPERIREILNILQPALTVTENENRHLLDEAGYSGNRYSLKSGIKEETDKKLLEEVRKKTTMDDILYGIFTSGSTGVPKGIVVSQKSVIDFIGHFIGRFGFSVKDRIGNQAPFDFDVSVKDIYSCIMTGAELVIIPKKMFSSPPVLLDYLCDKEVTVLIWAVSALTLVSSLKGLRYRVPGHVRKILFSGEVMPVRQLRQWQEAMPDTEFVNLYGPSEITCNCTFHIVEGLCEQDWKIPIGKPFQGREVFLLDEENNEIHNAQQTGEICVTGESLAEGYYRNPEETARRFVFYPLHGGKPVRCYRTGDLGYYGAGGELYFAGRKDFQIKHMGHRIELEEIEHAMNQIDGVERSCCVLDERRNQLAAFYLGEASPEDIRSRMKKKFPVYMVPHKILNTEIMPLTKNGKTDRAYFRQKMEVKK